MAAGEMFARSQIDASDELHDFSCAPCSDDGKNTEASFQCTDCQVFYCHKCVTGHKKFTQNHNVVEKSSDLFGEGRKHTRSRSLNELPTDLCEEHHGEVIKMYCGQHDLVCCTVCIAVKHRSCKDVEYIPNVAKGLLKGQDKDKTKSSLEKVKDDLETLKTKLQTELKELNQQRGEILDEIEKFKKSILEKVEELEKKSIKEVHDRHRGISDEITASCTKIGDLLEDVEKQLVKFKHSDSDSEAQIFVNIKYGEKQVSDGNKCARESIARKVNTLEFEVNRGLENYLLDVQSIGILTVRTPEDFVDSRSEEKKRKEKKTQSQIGEKTYKCHTCAEIYTDYLEFVTHSIAGQCT